MKQIQLSSNAHLLIILMGSLGDLVRGLSLLPAIKKAKPDCKITWLVDSRWTALLEAHPLIDNLLVLPRSFNLIDLKSFVSSLRKEKYDCVFDLQRIFKSGLLSFLSKSNLRVGFNPKNCKEFNNIFNNQFVEYQNDTFPKINYYHNFLKKINIESPEPYQFHLEYLENNLPEQIDSTQKYIAIVLESSWESKDWFYSGYQKLINLIIKESDCKLILLGTSKSSEVASKLEAEFSERCLNLTSKTNLTELASCLALAKVAVGPDSGPGHLAAAVETPYVTLFGPTSIDRVAPYQAEKYAIEANVACRPCYRKKCPGFNKVCMRMIRAEDVWGTVQKII